MIKLYTAATGNGRKPAIMLSELGLSYQLRRVDIANGEQKTPEFLAINPDGKIPVLVDDEGPGGQTHTLAESGAILLYLAQKSGRFLPHPPNARWEAITWLFWQASWMVQTLSQLRWLNANGEPDTPTFEYFRSEVIRQLGVLDEKLNHSEYLAGEYSIADMAAYPYVSAPNLGLAKLSLDDYPAVQRWATAVGERPAVKKGMALE